MPAAGWELLLPPELPVVGMVLGMVLYVLWPSRTASGTGAPCLPVHFVSHRGKPLFH